MSKTRFVPDSLGLGGSCLESRVVLSTLRARPAAVRRLPGVSFVVAIPPQTQASINFTSHTYWQIVKGGPTDLEDIADDFKDAGSDLRNWSLDGELREALSGLDRLAGRVPYGRQALLPIWVETLRSSVGLSEDAIEARLRSDLRSYLNGGVGISWNILRSGHKHSTDGDLIYTGKVK